jgi:uncharacterized membrane protein YtjA (UPF0391 family)
VIDGAKRPGPAHFGSSDPTPFLEPKPALSVARRKRSAIMSLLKGALTFFLISVVAAIFGFTGISAASADIARVLFFIFAVIFVVLLVLGVTIARRV